MNLKFSVRQFTEEDSADVVTIFRAINRQLAPDAMKAQFEAYIVLSVEDEIGRIPAYYFDRGGNFWVATEEQTLVAMCGVERINSVTAELRRMYVIPPVRGQGIARALLATLEEWCRLQGYLILTLSTSELQGPALGLYKSAGFQLCRKESAEKMTNKTVGGGIIRYYMKKRI